MAKGYVRWDFYKNCRNNGGTLSARHDLLKALTTIRTDICPILAESRRGNSPAYDGHSSFNGDLKPT